MPAKKIHNNEQINKAIENMASHGIKKAVVTRILGVDKSLINKEPYSTLYQNGSKKALNKVSSILWRELEKTNPDTRLLIFAAKNVMKWSDRDEETTEEIKNNVIQALDTQSTRELFGI